MLSMPPTLAYLTQSCTRSHAQGYYSPQYTYIPCHAQWDSESVAQVGGGLTGTVSELKLLYALRQLGSSMLLSTYLHSIQHAQHTCTQWLPTPLCASLALSVLCASQCTLCTYLYTLYIMFIISLTSLFHHLDRFCVRGCYFMSRSMP